MIRRWLEGLVDGFDPAGLVIRYRPGRPLRVRGWLPRGRHALVQQFLAEDLGAGGAVRIRGYREGLGRVKLVVDGRLGAEQAQRLRNFLIETLR